MIGTVERIAEPERRLWRVPQPIPIMLMVRELGAGGTERQLTELARSMDPDKFEVHVACFREGVRADELRSDGVPVLQLPITSFMKPTVLAATFRLGSYLRRLKIRLVHTFDYPLNCFGVLVARALGLPIVLSSQRAHRALTPPAYLKILRFTDHVVNGIVINSEAVRSDMILNEHVPASRLHLCNNGIDTMRFNAANRRRMPGLENASLVIGVVCVLRPEKGLPTLLEAFAQVAAEQPSIRLVIVGSGSELPRLEALAERLRIREKCLFQQATADVVPWLRSIDVFVLPSLSEALSNSLMEAMACGCACAASRTGGNPELVRHLETGLLFEPANVPDLSRQLSLLIRDSDLRSALAQNGCRRIREHFSLAASVAQMEQIYDLYLSKKVLLDSR